MKKLTIDYLMSNVSRPGLVVSVDAKDSVVSAARAMTDKKVGLVVVMQGEKLVGVLSERDIVRKWVCGKIFPKEVTVSEIMTKNVEVVSPDENILDCYLRFFARNCRHLPVLDSFGQVLGVLSMREVSRYLVERLDNEN